MKSYWEWLESSAMLDQERETGIGNGGDDFVNNDDGGDDDDYEDGPWGWKKMTCLNPKLHEWAKSSKYTQQIGQIFTQYLFEQPPTKEFCRVFPAHVQVEIEWIFNMEEWSEFDNQIETVLKKSDLYKPLRIRQEDLWNVVDKGAVYDYMLYVLIMALTGRQTTMRSYLDNQAAFYTWQYIRENWAEKQKAILQHIRDFHDENRMGHGLQIELLQPSKKPVGVSQSYRGHELWGKGIVIIPYKILNPRPENPEVWDSWGEERPMNYRLGQQRAM